MKDIKIYDAIGLFSILRAAKFTQVVNNEDMISVLDMALKLKVIVDEANAFKESIYKKYSDNPTHEELVCIMKEVKNKLDEVMHLDISTISKESFIQLIKGNDWNVEITLMLKGFLCA